MSQPIVINIGAIPNDGTGDPLRTAFNDVNLNFANVFTAGPVGSNIQIANNTILTTNTNGNLILNPNGIGVVQANAHVVPDQNRIRNLGSANQLWDTTYTQYLQTTYATIGTASIGNIGTFNIDVGNLHISGGTNGYVLQTDGTGNLTWTAQTGGTGNGTPGGANTQIQYNDGGAFGGTAGFIFDNTSNVLSVPGNVSAGNVLTSDQVIANGEIQSGTGFFTGGYLSVNGDTDLANVDVSGNLSAVGDISADAFVGDGSQLTNLPLATNSTPGAVALGNGFTLNSSNQVTTSSLYNTNLTQPTQHYALRVDTNGVVILPDQSIINGSTLRAVAGSYAGLTTDDGENSWMWVDSSGAYIATQYNESGNSHQWTFDNTGNLTLPGNGEISINYANGQPYGGTGSGGAAGNAGDIQINVAGGLGADSTLRYVDNGGEMTLYADYLNAPGIFTSDIYAGDGTPSNITLTTSYGNTWTFNNLGGTIFPTLNVQRGDNPSGTIQGQTLLFGDNAQEAIISTPDGVAGNEYSQRLVINPGAGYDYGEGGDIYLWAGRGGDNNGSGGDVKIRGGQGMGESGSGGYIRMEGGDSQDRGYPGYIDITAGYGANTYGAYVNITGGGGGNGQGGPVQIQGGFGAAGFKGGDANIIGGSSADGAGNYGNVNINSGGQTWAFDNTGLLTAPGAISAVGNIIGGNITTGGIANLYSVRMSQSISWPDYNGSEIYEDGALVINGPGGILATGNITAQFEFNDGDGNTAGLFSDIGNSVVYSVANVIVRSNNSGSQTDWTFDTTGNLTLPGNILGSGNILIAPDSASASSYLDIYLTGGPDIHIAGNDNSIVIGRDTGANIFVGNDGEVSIRTDNGVTPQVWNFDNTGNLTVPGNSIISTTIAIGGSAGNSISITAGAADQNNFNANSGGNLNLTGGLGGFNDDGSGGPGGDVNITAGSPGEAGGNAGNVTVNAGTNTWTFDYTGNITVPGNLNYEGIASPAPSINGFDSVNVITVNASGNISAVGNITGGNLVTAGSGGDITLSSGNITGANVVGANTISAAGNVSINANSNSWNFETTGDLTFPTGNLVITPDDAAFSNAAVVSSVNNLVTLSTGVNGGLSSLWVEDYANIGTSNIAAVYANPVPGSGNVRIAVGTNGGAGPNLWDFTATGNLSAPGNISATGNVTAANFFGNGSTLSNVVTTFESTWTVPTGNSTQSFTVTPSNTYYMWVDCNIPNGILTWNATATVTNTNVPVVGAQYAWVYTGGGSPIDFTSIPNQFTGTANTIVRSSVAPSSTTNRFDFGINNTSGNAVTVRYGYTKVS